MKTISIVLLALFYCINAQAYSNFIENPYTLYPPGCATIPELQTTLYGDNVVKFFEREVVLPILYSHEELPAKISAYRVACADADRSLIWLEFSLPEGSFYTLPGPPEVRAVIGNSQTTAMRLVDEPNGWGVGAASWFSSQIFEEDWHWDGRTPRKTWIFLLDNLTPFSAHFDPQVFMSPSQYNGSFNLEVNWRSDGGFVIEVPATAGLVTANPRIPLSGRLSGNWVVNGASDQGFVMAISEMVPETVPAPDELMDSRLLLFLSWFTYDADGGKLWLTGSAQFEMGASEIAMPIERVTNGQFLGGKEADRATVGNVTIIGNNCNDLRFEYDLTDLGLGSGTQHLQRLFSLETAGYVCRDLEARIGYLPSEN